METRLRTPMVLSLIANVGSQGDSVIDREARNRLAEAISSLVSGQITNGEFEDHLRGWSHDSAINEVFRGGPWMLYDDLHTYRLQGANKLTPELKTEAARWVLFLKTDLAYEWPVLSRPARLLFVLTNICTVGLAGFLYRRRLKQVGDISVWPFVRYSDYEAALEQPPYLSRFTSK
jgi:hypothetical protein